MKKKYFVHNDEIDLFAVFKIIWNDKLKIILVTIISFLIGLGYNYKLPNTHNNLLVLKTGKKSELNEISTIAINLGMYQKQINQLDKIILDKFIIELMDYEELIFILKNNKNIEKNISNFPKNKQQQLLFRYTKLLKINKSNNNSDFILSLHWDDTEEAKGILKNLINFTEINLKKLIIKELEQNLEAKKNLLIKKDRERVDYLLEQSLIANEIGMSDPSPTYQDNYLRGYRSINKEIEIIKNRKYENLSDIQNQISNLKQRNLSLVYYNIDSIESKLLKNTKSILLISIVFGLIVGVFFVIISVIISRASEA